MNNSVVNPQSILNTFSKLQTVLDVPPPLLIKGQITRSVGLAMVCEGIQVPVGTVCLIENKNQNPIEAVVTGFDGDQVYLMPIKSIQGIGLGSPVRSTGHPLNLLITDALLGRVIDGNGEPLDGKSLPSSGEIRYLNNRPLNPLLRTPIRQPLDVGIRAINGLLSIGQGQRIGLFAGSGVGKSILLGMMSRFTQADVVVVALIGERGREVNEFIHDNLGKSGLQRSVVVASPADYSPVLRLNGGLMAMTLAEYFRDQGKKVLLLMDSLSRFAQAQREIALATGEPPATKGYPPSVFTLLPQLVERAGTGSVGQGSITAVFTVLAEGDDPNDPIVDASRAILDGHIVLSRKLSDLGHYPAIDIESSVSRVMPNIVTPQQMKDAVAFKRFHSMYQQNVDLLNIGAYVKGSNPELDFAISKMPGFNAYLQQSVTERLDYQSSVNLLSSLLQRSDSEADEMKGLSVESSNLPMTHA